LRRSEADLGAAAAVLGKAKHRVQRAVKGIKCPIDNVALRNRELLLKELATPDFHERRFAKRPKWKRQLSSLSANRQRAKA
jgi:hypothetical protein